MNGAFSLLPDYTQHLTIRVRVILIFNSSTAVIISPTRVLFFSDSSFNRSFAFISWEMSQGINASSPISRFARLVDSMKYAAAALLMAIRQQCSMRHRRTTAHEQG